MIRSTPFATRLQLARAEAGLSYGQLAERTGLSKTHVWHLCNGLADNPTIESVELLGAALRVPPAYLAGWGG